METYVGRVDGVPAPGDAEHAVAAGLDNKVVGSLGAGFGRNNVFDAAIAAVTACDACPHGDW